MKNQLFFKIIPLLLSVFVILSCNNTQTTEDKFEEAIEDVADAFRSEKAEMEADLKELQEDIQDRLANLEEQLTNAQDDAKEEIQDEIDNLEKAEQKLQVKMKEVQEAATLEWKSFKASFNEWMEEVEDELQS